MDKQRKYVLIDRVAVWRPVSKKMNTRTYKSNIQYVEEKSPIIQIATETNPITRYVKDFEKFSLEFSLFVWTDKPLEQIEAAFEKTVKALKKKDITESLSIGGSGFNYTDVSVEDK